MTTDPNLATPPEGGDLDAYTSHLYGLGLAPHSIRIYIRHLRRAIDGMAAAGTTLETATPEEIALYAATVPNSNSSRRQLRTTLKHYWTMTGRIDPPARAVRVPPKPRGICRAIEPDDARILVKTSLGWHPNGLAVLFGLYMALRAGEIASARWDRFDPDFEWYTVLGKGDVTATLPVHPILRGELEGHQSAYVYLFPGSRRRAHVTPTTVWQWTRDVGTEVGLNHLHTHQLRHTALATANDATGDLRATQSFARHARPETTAIYTRTTATRLRAVVDALDYLSDGAGTLPPLAGGSP